MTLKSKYISYWLDKMENSYGSMGFGFFPDNTIKNKDLGIEIKYNTDENSHYLYKPNLIKIVGKNKKRLNKILKDGLGWKSK